MHRNIGIVTVAGLCLVGLASCATASLTSTQASSVPQQESNQAEQNLLPLPSFDLSFLQRIEIQLPHEKDESRLKIQLTAGKLVTFRSCNDAAVYLGYFDPKVDPQGESNSGGTYYVLSIGSLGFPMMPCAPNPVTTQKWIQVSDFREFNLKSRQYGKTRSDLFLPYDSHLPLTIYVSRGFTLSYKVVPRERVTP